MKKMRNPLVIGYKGEIGSFILNGLLRVMPKALDIWCVDVNELSIEIEERIKLSDVIFLCVPMGMTVDWLVRHKDLLDGKVILEQCSLKEDICRDKRLDGLDIRSMHILFRPSQTPNLEDRKVGLMRNQFDSKFAKVISNITQSEIVWYKDTEEHDKEMAIQQALVHRTLLILGDTLKGCNGSTYISKKVVELSERIKKGDIGLYGLIQDNKHLPEHLEKMEKDLSEFKIEKHMVA